MLPSLLRSLKAHNELAQRTADARVTYDALAFLRQCREAFGALTDTVQQGRLEDGMKDADSVSILLDSASPSVAQAQLMSDMKVLVSTKYISRVMTNSLPLQSQLRSLKDRVAEQLSDAYSRSIQVTSTELWIAHSVQGQFPSASVASFSQADARLY